MRSTFFWDLGGAPWECWALVVQRRSSDAKNISDRVTALPPDRPKQTSVPTTHQVRGQRASSRKELQTVL